MNKSIFIVMGVSGTGKTTIGKLLSKAYNFPFFDGDDFHPKANIEKMTSGRPLNDKDRAGWLQSLNNLSKKHLLSGAIIACSALKEKYRDILRDEIEEQMVFIYLKGTFEDVKTRLENRKGHYMTSALLQSQFDALEEPKNAMEVSIELSPDEIIAAIQNQLK
ncbi:gluconokinase [Croceitalea rosinachiae]|uniref:Gluconokinase n=1 Tax=Croceitalea rosinachiae TaxID=3075596 RepID=A0ABU3AAS2_9FLAO|nr:gluconokinase [Croceitalea sp. F388]MDT0607283.1 gluconokinase [Croceitalea sp. F388]